MHYIGVSLRKATLCIGRLCTEREGGGSGLVFGRLNAELAFSNLPEALFGGTQAFAPKSWWISQFIARFVSDRSHRIRSTKKHSRKVSKCTDLLHAFQTPVQIRPLLFPRCSLLIQSWFSQDDGTPGVWRAGRYWYRTNKAHESHKVQ